MLEMDLSNSHLAEHLLYKFVVHFLVVFVIFEGLLHFLHPYPFVERINHLLLLLEDVTKDGLLLLELLEELSDLGIAILKDRL